MFNKKHRTGNFQVALMLAKDRGAIVGLQGHRNKKNAIAFAEDCSFTDSSEHSQWLQAMKRKYSVASSACNLILTANSYQLIQADLSGLEGDDRRDAARWQIRENLEYSSDEAVVDVFDVVPFGSDRKTLNYVVAAPLSSLKTVVQTLRDTEVELTTIDIPELALRNICALSRDDERGTAMLWLAENEGMLAIVRDGQLYLARSFSVGMSHLRPYGQGDYEGLTEQLDDVVLEVQRSFDFCESTFLLPMVSRLLVAQCGVEIPAVCHYLNEYLATSVEAFNWSDYFDVTPDLATQDLNSLLLVVGGALRVESS